MFTATFNVSQLACIKSDINRLIKHDEVTIIYHKKRKEEKSPSEFAHVTEEEN